MGVRVQLAGAGMDADPAQTLVPGMTLLAQAVMNAVR